MKVKVGLFIGLFFICANVAFTLDYYALLDVAKDADSNEIKRGYRK